MPQSWPPKVGDTVLVKRWRNENPGGPTQARGEVVSIQGAGDSAVYAVNCRTFRYVDASGQVKNTALEPLGCSISQIEPME
jgi:hypothetical protein